MKFRNWGKTPIDFIQIVVTRASQNKPSDRGLYSLILEIQTCGFLWCFWGAISSLSCWCLFDGLKRIKLCGIMDFHPIAHCEIIKLQYSRSGNLNINHHIIICVKLIKKWHIVNRVHIVQCYNIYLYIIYIWICYYRI